jgi:aspartyl-tRNA(Asn)/glutamyl-tRNA(Gln) amidotransferase subunit B
VCLGLPGALPVTNEAVVDKGLLVALALHSEASAVAEFARKNYFYPDLPKGYQITQHAAPLARGGYLEVDVEGETSRVRIRQIHLEEDAGKSLHAGRAAGGLLDMNRCGVPLVEIVTEPDICSVELADAFLTELRDILVYLGVSECNMHEGGLRFDTNISLRASGGEAPGTHTEIKNLSSFRSVRRALSYEIDRQTRILGSGGEVRYETVFWDEREQRALTARSKEGASDYRYFPEPDLVRFRVDGDRVDRMSLALPELPAEARSRIVSDHGVSPYDARVIVSDPEVLALYEACVSATEKLLAGTSGLRPGKTVASWITVVLAGYMNERGVGVSELCRRVASERTGRTGACPSPESRVSAGLSKAIPGLDELARRIGEVIAMRLRGNLAEPAARRLFTAALESREPVDALVAEMGLDSAPDESQLADVVSEVLAAHPEEVSRYRDGVEKLLHYFVGETMRLTEGKGDPELATRILLKQLASTGGPDTEDDR